MIETVTKRFLKLIIAFAMVITSFTAPTRTVRAEDEVPGSKIQLNGDEELTPADKDLDKIKTWEFKANAGKGVVVYANDPDGNLPEGTKMVAKVVDSEKVAKLIGKKVKGNIRKITAVDITFKYKGKEIEPTGPVSVSIWAPGMEKGTTKKLVHIDDAEEVTLISDVTTSKEGEMTTATFEADGFSIYAIVETGEDARVLVKFMNGSTEIESMYVKSADAAKISTVLYDPGAGTIPEGAYFRGWTIDPNYTTDTPAKTIADVRTEVLAMCPPATDGTVVTYYAMLFKDYRITYLDEHQVSLGQEEVSFRADSTTTEQSYKVNMGYTVQDINYHFEGWKVREGSSNIVGYEEGHAYQNNDIITITGDIVFGVNAPKGNWFIFDENGKGATYNAPQFIHQGNTPSRPDDADMTRNGYTFGGWFATKAEADQTSGGTQYDFNQQLTDKTTVYARWIPNTRANYTVLIWLENLDGAGYDFKEAISLEGTVGNTINTVVQQGTGNNAYARVNNVNKQYTGFHLDHFDQSVVIATEGNSVVNVYYTRTEYTLTFRIGNTTVRTITEKYGKPIASYFPITNQNNNTEYDSYVWAPASGTQSFKQILVIIDTMPAESITFTGTDRGAGTSYETNNDYHNFKLQYYLQPDDLSTNHDDYELYNEVTAVYRRVTEAEDFITISGFDKESSVPAFSYNSQIEGNSIEYNSASAEYVYTVSTGDNDNNPAKYGDVNGQKQRVYWNYGAFRIADHWYSDEYTGTVYTRSQVMTIKFYYTRSVYSINFLDGKYVDGDNKPLTEAGMGQIGTADNLAYGSDVSSYNAYKPNAAHTPSGYVFEGWYIDSACTQPYTFTTMPEGGVTVYAKWRQKQYRVFLHVNYPEGATGNINWGTANQSMTFRISEGGHVSEPTGRDLAGFEFDGWYLDPGFTQVFNGEAYTINESNVTTPYDKTVDMTDTYNNNGQLIGPNYNSDLTGWDDDNDSSTPGKERFWITTKLDIYAKWHSSLEGASGIVVEYDANGGTGAPVDTNTYVDGAKAPAGAASKSTNPNKVFGYWVVQKWVNGAWTDTDTKVLPGQTFSVLKANAKVVDLETPTASGDTKRYTVQLRAEYLDTEKPTPTHIYWYKNDGTDAFQKDEGVEINVGVDIEPAQTREGYTFLGWARVSIGQTPEEAAAWEANSANWSQNLTANDLYLHYKSSDETFHLDSTSGTAVTQVAPDENLPYHAMFAVWEENEVTINYAVASDSTGMGTVSRESETIKAASGTAQGSTATAESSRYIFDYWTVDNGTEHISDAAAFVPSKNANGVYEEHTYYAHFKLNKANVTVHHYLKGTTTQVADDVTSSEVIGTEYTAEPVTTYQGKALTVDSYNPSQTVTVSADGNVITIYYTLALTIVAKTDSKTYDGTPLDGEYTITGALDSDLAGIEDALGDAPSITNVAESPKDYLTTTEQAAVTAAIPSYYTVSYTEGTLTINPKPVTVTVADKTVEYNGSKQYGNTEYTFEGLLTGHTGTVTYTPSEGTLVGEYTNGSYADDLKIMNGSEDVTSNYTVTPTTGKLTITDRTEKYEITVVANSNTGNVYDGTEKSATGFVTLEFTVGGNTYTVSGLTTSDPVSTNVCNLANAISGTAVVKDAAGNDVTAQFTVKTTNGTLEITPREITVKVEDKTVEYNGSEQSGNTEYTFSGLLSGHTGTITYTPSKGTLVGTYNNGSYGDDFAVVDGNGNDVTANYTLKTKTAGKLTITDRTNKYEITVVAKSNTGNVYDGTEKKAEGFETLTFTVDGNTYTVEGLTTSDPKSTNVCDLANAISGTAVVKDAAGNDVTAQFTVKTENGRLEITPKEITVSVTDKTVEYNGSEQSGNTAYTFSGLLSGHTGTITYTPSKGTLVGTYDNGSYGNDFAVVDGSDNDVTGNYTLTTKTVGKLIITDRTNKYEITVVAKSNTGNVYDGTAKSATGFETLEFEVDGNTYMVSGLTTSDPTSTNVCDLANAISGTAVVKDAAGNDVTAQFTVHTTDGRLEITKRSITFTGVSDSKVYTGEEQELTGIEIGGDGLVTGHTHNVVYSAKGTDVGTYPGTITDKAGVKILDAQGNDVTSNYDITTAPGTLTITKTTALLTVTLPSESFVYDAAPHSLAGPATTNAASGTTTIEYSVDGQTWTSNLAQITRTNVSVTTIHVRAINNNYDNIAENTATLTITKRPVTFTAKSETHEYTGSEITINTVEQEGLVSGHTHNVVFEAKGTEVGTYEGTITAKADVVIKSGDEDVTANYDITVVNGQLEITKTDEEFTIALEDDEYTYDAAEHYNANTATSTATTGTTTFSYSFTENGEYVSDLTSLTKVAAGEYTIYVKGTNPNYEGTATTTAKLIINPKKVTITAASNTWPYDGNAHTDGSFTATDLEEGDDHTFTVAMTAESTITNVGTQPNVIATVDGVAVETGVEKQIGNYLVKTVDGELEITQDTAALVITSATTSWMYNGELHKDETYTVTYNSEEVTSEDGKTFVLDNGDVITITATALGVKNVGDNAEKNNTYTYTIKNGATDTSGNYASVTANVGTLTITPRLVTLTSATAEKEYDGNPLTNHNVTVTGDGFVDGEGATYNVTGTQTLVGFSANKFTYTLNEGTLAENYTITTSEGTLTVTNRNAKYEIELEPNGAEFLYDGTEKSVSGFKNLTFTIEGNTYTVSGVEAGVKGTDAATYKVVVTGTAVVKDAAGNDVTDQFKVTIKDANLVINPRKVTLTSATDSKEYDGTPLTNDEVKVTGDGWAEGEGASYDVTGSRTIVGESKNTFSYTLNEGTKASNYVITTVEGTLTVTDRTEPFVITVVSIDGTAKYDGKDHTIEGFETLEFTENGQKYTVEGLTASATGKNAGDYTNKITGTPVVKDALGNDVTDQFTVNEVEGKLTITKRTVTLTSAGAEKVYDGTPLTRNEQTDITVGGDGWAEGEGALYNITGTQTTVGSSGNAFTYTLNEGTLAENYEIEQVIGNLKVTALTDKVTVTITEHKGTFEYDGTEKTVTGYDVAIDNALYTEADFTFSGNDEVKGIYVGKYDMELKPADFTNTNKNFSNVVFVIVDGQLEITKAKLTITADSNSKPYDGTALTDDGWMDTAPVGLKSTDEVTSVTVTGSQTVVGSSANVPSDAVVMNGTTDVTANYEIEYVNGTLTVTKNETELTVASSDGTWKYDGDAHTQYEYTVTYGDETYTVKVAEGATTATATLSTGDKVTITPAATATITHVAESKVDNAFTWTVEHEDGYTIGEDTVGKLSITPRSVTLTSADDQKEYDGTPLTNDEVTVSGDGFVKEEGATYNVTGSQTVVGESANTFTYTLKENTQADDYEIETVEGTLKVVKNASKELKVESSDGTWKYDGEEHVKYEYTVTYGDETYTVTIAEGATTAVATLKSGDKVTITPDVTAKVKNVSDSAEEKNTFTWTVEHEAGYTIGEDTYGDLEITPRSVIMTSADDEKVYDGTPLTNDTVTVTGDGFVEGEGATYNVTGSQTNVGSSGNAFTYTLNEGTLAENYEIEKVIGNLKVTALTDKVTVTITEHKGTFEYDGTEKTVTGYDVSIDNELYTEADFTFSGNDEVNGTYVNTYDMELKPEDFTNISTNFTNVVFVIVDGQLEITKAPLKITADSNSKEYDGTPLTDDGWQDVPPEGLKSTDEVTSVTVTGSQTLVGSSDNVPSAAVVKNGDKDVTENYEIEYVNGTLTVVKNTSKVLKVESLDGTWMYDGEEHTQYQYTVTYGDETIEGEAGQFEFTLSTGDKLTVTAAAAAKITHVAESDVDNAFTWTIEHPEGYTFGEDTVGKLSITPRSVTLTSADDEKEYDGKPLTNDEVTVSEDGFVDGEGATYDVTGSQTLVGESPNTFTYTLNENTQADDYVIETVEGTLKVVKNTSKELKIESADGSWMYDGEEHTQHQYTVTYGDEVIEGTLEQFEFTLSTGDKVVITPDDGAKVKNVSDTAPKKNTFTWTIEHEEGYTIGEDTYGDLEITPRSVIMTSADDSKEYDGKPLTNDTVTVTGDGFIEGEGASYNVTGSQTLVGNSGNAFTYTLNEGTLAENYDIEQVIGNLEVTDRTEPFEITVVSISGSAMYDAKNHTIEGFETLEFTIDGVNFTVEGLEASATGKNVGTYTNVITGTAIVRDENGNDVTKQFTVNEVEGELEITKRSVTLTSATDEKVYDGTPLTNDTVTVTGDGFAEGEGASYDVTGSQLNVGESDNEFTYELNEGTLAENYDITVVFGTLKVTPVTDKVTVTITEHNGTEKYDGTEKTVTGYDVEIDNELYTEEDFTFSGDDTVKGTNAGKYDMELKPEDFENISINFTNVEFVIVDGQLEITKRQVTLTSADDEKEYDATPLTNDTVTVTGDGFAEGEGASYDVTGSQTLVGSSDNEFTYTLNEGTLADNYDITVVFGTLTVTANTTAHIIVTAEDADKVYDGTPLTEDGFKVEGLEEFEGLTVEAVIEGSITDVGTEDNTVVSIKIYDKDGNDVTDMFDPATIEFIKGTLTVNKRKVVIKSASDEKVYDGTPLTNPEVTIEGDGFVEGEIKEVRAVGTITYVGSTANTIEIVGNDGSLIENVLSFFGLKKNASEYKAENYDITVEEGTLTVTEPSDDSAVVTKSHKGDDFKEGDVVTFRIEVTNIYNEAKDITLVEIEGVTLAKDSFKNVKPGETVKTTATYTITDEDVVNGKFVNTVEAVFDDKTYEAEDTATTADARPAISLVKIATSKPANGEAYVKGEVIEYEIKVTNTGDATLYDVKTTDDLTGDVWTKDVLAIGESIVYKTSYTVTDEDVANGKVVNTAVAVAHDLAGTVVTSIGVRTSAEDDITLYTGLFGGSLAAVFGLYIFLKKRREEEEYA